MGQTDGGLIGTSAKHASLSEWPLSWLDGISMGKTDGPVDDHKRQAQNGVVHQGEPGYFSFDFDLRTGKNKQEKNSPLTPFQALRYLFPHICSIFSSRTGFYRNLGGRSNSVYRPHLPFIEICQSFELNLFIHGDKVSVSNLRSIKHHMTILVVKITWWGLPGFDSTSPTSTGRPWWLISRSSSFLFSTDVIS